jgi:tRNA-dihydrouridine synthase B
MFKKLGSCLVTMKIIKSHLKNAIALAPMAGITDKPFRKICRKLGADYAVSEMVASKLELWDRPNTRARLNMEGEASPRVIQLVGSDPEVMAKAACIAQDNGADVIDINMGCPAKKVCGKAAGSALMRDTKKVSSILARVVNSVQVPVTLKIRTGWSLENKNAVDIARIAVSEGITGLVIHGRTRACKFNGTAEHETAATIKQAVFIPVVANGDITSGAVARNLFDNFGIDGLMIGRAARGNPWLFASVKACLNDLPWTAPTLEERVVVMSDHLQEIYEHYGQPKGLLMARKHIGWYLDAFPNAPVLRKMFNAILDVAEQQFFLRSILNYIDAEVAA